MSVNICRGRKIAVTEPLLDLFHGNAVCEHQAGARVPEIVKTNVPQSVGFQKLRKLLRHIVGLDKITGWTYKGSANAPSVSGNTGKGSVTYEYKGANDNNYKTNNTTAADNNNVKENVAKTNNYKAG